MVLIFCATHLQVYNQPLCSIFTYSTNPDFAGHCETLPKTCSNEDRWCNGDGGQNNGPTIVQELIAGQLAKSLSGLTGGELY